MIDVAKFSACFCHQSINHPVCKSLVGMKDEGLKELCRDLSSKKANFFNQ